MTELYHYGVIGMKWGVRRTPEQLGHSPKSEQKAFKKQVRADEKTWRSNRRDVATAQKDYKRTAKRYQRTMQDVEKQTKKLTKTRSKLTMPWNREKRQAEIDRLKKDLDSFLERSEMDAGRMARTKSRMESEIQKTVDFVDSLNEKYGKENVRQMNPKTIAKGKAYAKEGLKTGLNATALPFIGRYLSDKQIATWEREWQKKLTSERIEDLDRKRYA